MPRWRLVSVRQMLISHTLIGTALRIMWPFGDDREDLPADEYILLAWAGHRSLFSHQSPSVTKKRAMADSSAASSRLDSLKGVGATSPKAPVTEGEWKNHMFLRPLAPEDAAQLGRFAHSDTMQLKRVGAANFRPLAEDIERLSEAANPMKSLSTLPSLSDVLTARRAAGVWQARAGVRRITKSYKSQTVPNLRSVKSDAIAVSRKSRRGTNGSGISLGAVRSSGVCVHASAPS